MRPITIDQSHQLMAVLATNVNWKKLDFNMLQDAIIRDPKGAGKRFTEFLENGGRFFNKIKSVLTKSFNPAKFIGKDWAIWRGPANGGGFSGEEDIDPRSLVFTQIEIDKFIFETCLRENETPVTGEKKLLRLKAKPDFVRFGGNVFLGLWLDYQDNKENSILECLYRNHKISYLDFFGTILRHPRGDRFVLCLYRRDDGEWYCDCRWLVQDWSACHLSVGCAS